MTLTLPETLAALRALDTPSDILTQACQKILGMSDGKGPEELTKNITKLIIQANVEPAVAVLAISEATGHIAGIACKPGCELAMMEGILGAIREAFVEARSWSLTNAARGNPEKLRELLLTLLTQEKEPSA